MTYLRKLLLPVLVCCLCYNQNFAQQADPHYHIKSTNYIAAKNYYLLTLMRSSAAVRKLLESDEALNKLAAAKVEAINTSLKCKEVSCFTAQLKFSADEIKMVGERLAKLYQPGNALGLLVKTDLIPSGAYILYKNLSPQQQLVKAWEQDAEGVNYAISVYADGKKPRYAAIDSISFNVKSKNYPDILLDEATTIDQQCKNTRLFFEPVLAYALQAMEINGRHDAANFEPLTTGLNKATLAKIKQTQWGKYKYSAILVLGFGPEDYTTEISAGGMLRSKFAAARYFAGLAPFIIVSGGMAHPYKTKYCEAVEMKKYLVNTLHVPADAIIVETQARHTTTNVRNAVRLIYHYGIPAAMPFATVSSKGHITSVGTTMAARCMKELKYVPYKLGNRLDDNTWELYPVLEVLQINPIDPLDP